MKTSLEEVLAAHSGLLEKGLGSIKGMTVKLYVNLQAKPRFFHPRSVPYALHSRVEQALESLESEGIIEHVYFSEWAMLIVPVVKRDGTIRICGDYIKAYRESGSTHECISSATGGRLVFLASWRNLLHKAGPILRLKPASTGRGVT